MDFEEFVEYAQKIEGAAQTAAGVAGAGGYTVGAAIQGYKDGKNGDTSRYRQINDIDVQAGLNEESAKTLKVVAVLAVAAVVFYIIYKKRNK